MPDLDTFYAESGDTAQLQLGFEEKHGKLILRTPWLEESQGGRGVSIPWQRSYSMPRR